LNRLKKLIRWLYHDSIFHLTVFIIGTAIFGLYLRTPSTSDSNQLRQSKVELSSLDNLRGFHFFLVGKKIPLESARISDLYVKWQLESDVSVILVHLTRGHWSRSLDRL
jgi:hypothetical protein